MAINNHSVKRLTQQLASASLAELQFSQSATQNILNQSKNQCLCNNHHRHHQIISHQQRFFAYNSTTKFRNEEKEFREEELKANYQKKKAEQQMQGIATTTDHLPKSLEIQDDLDLNLQKPLNQQQQNEIQPDGNRGLAGQPNNEDELGDYQEYYILNRDELIRKRKEKEEEAKFGDFSAKLVKRPQKNFLWGFGTQIHDENKDYFTKGKLPTIREIIRFLEIYQMKDISVVNLKALGRDQMENYAIVCSGFSVKHLYNTAKLLNQEIKKLECPQIINKPKIAGRKDDSWFMLTVKEIQVHMILHEYREDLDLEFRWLNPPPQEITQIIKIFQEMVNKWKLYEKMGKRSDNIQFDQDPFKQYQHYDDSKQREFRKSKGAKDSQEQPDSNAQEAAKQ